MLRPISGWHRCATSGGTCNRPRNSHDIEISIAVQIHNKSAKVILTTTRNDVLNPGSPVAHILPDLQPLCAAVLGRDDVRTAVVVHIANVRAVGGELCGQLMTHPVRADRAGRILKPVDTVTIP